MLEVFGAFAGKMSTRQVFYQLVSRGVIKNTNRGYDCCQRLLVHMRREGLIAYHRVVDRTRRKHHRQGWEGLDDLLQTSAEAYRRDYWASRDVVPYIAVEKQALEGVFSSVVDQFGVPLWVLRGFASEAFAYELAQDIIEATSQGKQVRIFFFGDHDPSGLALELDCLKKVRSHGAEFEWERRGLLFSDMADFGLINVPVKPSDSRAKEYLKKFGNRAAELDALPPDELERRIREAILECIDQTSWQQHEAAEREERSTLQSFGANWLEALTSGKKEGSE